MAGDASLDGRATNQGPKGTTTWLGNDDEPMCSAVQARCQPDFQAPRRVPNFFNCRRSLAASASSQSRNVTILGSVVVAFGQMIQ